MRIRFKNGFEITKKELDRKTIDELYDIHQDLNNSYAHGNDKGQLDILEGYIEERALKEAI